MLLLATLAIVLPVIPVAIWLGGRLHCDAPARLTLVAGYALLLGMIAATVLLRLLDLSHVPLSRLTLGLAVALFTAVAFAARRRAVPAVSGAGYRHEAPLSPLSRAIIVLFLALIALRLGTLAAELLSRPLYPWDAMMHWATKARVWFDAGELLPFVDRQRWLELGGAGVYTDVHPDYPRTVPLLQLWVSTLIGRWNESLINLPWLAAAVALALIVYSQGRIAGASVVAALVTTYLVVSMPLLDTQVALAGYADVILGVVFCAACAAFYNWAAQRDPGQGWLAILLVASCPLIKNEGLYWSLSFFPALLFLLAPLRYVYASAAVLSVAGAGLLAIGSEWEIVGHSLATLRLELRSEAIGPLLRSIWVHDNWHLLPWFLLAMLLLTLLRGRMPSRPLLALGVAQATAILMFGFLFLYTRFSYGAIHYSAAGRIGLHLAPGLVFTTLLLYLHVAGRIRDRPRRQG